MIVANNITGLMTMRLTLGELSITYKATKLLSCCVVLLTLVINEIIIRMLSIMI